VCGAVRVAELGETLIFSEHVCSMRKSMFISQPHGQGSHELEKPLFAFNRVPRFSYLIAKLGKQTVLKQLYVHFLQNNITAVLFLQCLFLRSSMLLVTAWQVLPFYLLCDNMALNVATQRWLRW